MTKTINYIRVEQLLNSCRGTHFTKMARQVFVPELNEYRDEDDGETTTDVYVSVDPKKKQPSIYEMEDAIAKKMDARVEGANPKLVPAFNPAGLIIPTTTTLAGLLAGYILSGRDSVTGKKKNLKRNLLRGGILGLLGGVVGKGLWNAKHRADVLSTTIPVIHNGARVYQARDKEIRDGYAEWEKWKRLYGADARDRHTYEAERKRERRKEFYTVQPGDIYSEAEREKAYCEVHNLDYDEEKILDRMIGAKEIPSPPDYYSGDPISVRIADSMDGIQALHDYRFKRPLTSSIFPRVINSSGLVFPLVGAASGVAVAPYLFDRKNKDKTTRKDAIKRFLRNCGMGLLGATTGSAAKYALKPSYEPSSVSGQIPKDLASVTNSWRSSLYRHALSDSFIESAK